MENILFKPELRGYSYFETINNFESYFINWSHTFSSRFPLSNGLVVSPWAVPQLLLTFLFIFSESNKNMQFHRTFILCCQYNHCFCQHWLWLPTWMRRRWVSLFIINNRFVVLLIYSNSGSKIKIFRDSISTSDNRLFKFEILSLKF